MNVKETFLCHENEEECLGFQPSRHVSFPKVSILHIRRGTRWNPQIRENNPFAYSKLWW